MGSDRQFLRYLDGVKNSISFETARTFVAKKFVTIGRRFAVIRRRRIRDVTKLTLFGDCAESMHRIALILLYSWSAWKYGSDYVTFVPLAQIFGMCQIWGDDVIKKKHTISKVSPDLSRYRSWSYPTYFSTLRKMQSKSTRSDVSLSIYHRITTLCKNAPGGYPALDFRGLCAC